MARYGVNPKWADEMRKKLNETIFEPVIISYAPGVKWLITVIAEKGLTPKVENLGAGVKRIGVAGQCCPACGKPF